MEEQSQGHIDSAQAELDPEVRRVLTQATSEVSQTPAREEAGGDPTITVSPATSLRVETERVQSQTAPRGRRNSRSPLIREEERSRSPSSSSREKFKNYRTRDYDEGCESHESGSMSEPFSPQYYSLPLTRPPPNLYRCDAGLLWEITANGPPVRVEETWDNEYAVSQDQTPVPQNPRPLPGSARTVEAVVHGTYLPTGKRQARSPTKPPPPPPKLPASGYQQEEGYYVPRRQFYHPRDPLPDADPAYKPRRHRKRGKKKSKAAKEFQLLQQQALASGYTLQPRSVPQASSSLPIQVPQGNPSPRILPQQTPARSRSRDTPSRKADYERRVAIENQRQYLEEERDRSLPPRFTDHSGDVREKDFLREQAERERQEVAAREAVQQERHNRWLHQTGVLPPPVEWQRIVDRAERADRARRVEIGEARRDQDVRHSALSPSRLANRIEAPRAPTHSATLRSPGTTPKPHKIRPWEEAGLTLLKWARNQSAMSNPPAPGRIQLIDPALMETLSADRIAIRDLPEVLRWNAEQKKVDELIKSSNALTESRLAEAAAEKTRNDSQLASYKAQLEALRAHIQVTPLPENQPATSPAHSQAPRRVPPPLVKRVPLPDEESRTARVSPTESPISIRASPTSEKEPQSQESTPHREKPPSPNKVQPLVEEKSSEDSVPHLNLRDLRVWLYEKLGDRIQPPPEIDVAANRGLCDTDADAPRLKPGNSFPLSSGILNRAERLQASWQNIQIPKDKTSEANFVASEQPNYARDDDPIDRFTSRAGVKDFAINDPRSTFLKLSSSYSCHDANRMALNAFTPVDAEVAAVFPGKSTIPFPVSRVENFETLGRAVTLIASQQDIILAGLSSHLTEVFTGEGSSGLPKEFVESANFPMMKKAIDSLVFGIRHHTDLGLKVTGNCVRARRTYYLDQSNVTPEIRAQLLAQPILANTLFAGRLPEIERRASELLRPYTFGKKAASRSRSSSAGAPKAPASGGGNSGSGGASSRTPAKSATAKDSNRRSRSTSARGRKNKGGGGAGKGSANSAQQKS